MGRPFTLPVRIMVESDRIILYVLRWKLEDDHRNPFGTQSTADIGSIGCGERGYCH